MRENKNKKKKPYLKAILFGTLSISAYVIVFTNQDIITNNFTKGGIYAILPIITVFFFSFIHGPFASHVLSILGFEAKKKKIKEEQGK